MKKSILFFAVLLTPLVMMLVIPKTIYAADAVNVINDVCKNPSAANASICLDDQTDTSESNSPIFGPRGMVTIGLQILNIVAGVVVVFVIVISGVRFMSSQGDSNSVSQARNALLYGVFGLVIVLASQIIITFILRKI